VSLFNTHLAWISPIVSRILSRVSWLLRPRSEKKEEKKKADPPDLPIDDTTTTAAAAAAAAAVFIGGFDGKSRWRCIVL